MFGKIGAKMVSVSEKVITAKDIFRRLGKPEVASTIFLLDREYGRQREAEAIAREILTSIWIRIEDPAKITEADCPPILMRAVSGKDGNYTLAAVLESDYDCRLYAQIIRNNRGVKLKIWQTDSHGRLIKGRSKGYSAESYIREGTLSSMIIAATKAMPSNRT